MLMLSTACRSWAGDGRRRASGRREPRRGAGGGCRRRARRRDAAAVRQQQLAARAFAKLPVSFIENRGQTDARVRYYAQGSQLRRSS